MIFLKRSFFIALIVLFASICSFNCQGTEKGKKPGHGGIGTKNKKKDDVRQQLDKKYEDEFKKLCKQAKKIKDEFRKANELASGNKPTNEDKEKIKNHLKDTLNSGKIGLIEDLAGKKQHYRIEKGINKGTYEIQINGKFKAGDKKGTTVSNVRALDEVIHLVDQMKPTEEFKNSVGKKYNTLIVNALIKSLDTGKTENIDAIPLLKEIKNEFNFKETC